MKTSYKIILINLLAAVVITAFLLLINQSSYNSGSDTALAFGLVCLGMGGLNLFVGLILLFTDKRDWGTGMLLSFAMLLLLSGISCGAGFSGMNFR